MRQNFIRLLEKRDGELSDLDVEFYIMKLENVPDKMIRGVPYLRILFLTLKYIHNVLLCRKMNEIIVIFNEIFDIESTLQIMDYRKSLMFWVWRSSRLQNIQIDCKREAE
jgi:hypothetical protein